MVSYSLARLIPMESSNNISSVERQEQILRLIERQQRLSVPEICDQFSVSEATARRDLEILSNQGRIKRVHGGAIAIHRAPPEFPILQRTTEQAEEKQRIGRTAADMVQPGETVFLGSGTTVVEVARNLRHLPNLTVITNSLPVVNTLADVSQITIIALGGILRESELSFIGHITEQSLAEVRADKVIMGIRALSLEQGLTNDYLPETMTDRAILLIGKEVIIVADHTKLGRISTAFVAPLSSVHKLVTDQQASEDFISAISALGIQVVTC